MDSMDYQEYTVFTSTNKAGEEIELAVVDEFEFKHKNYVVGALIENDTVNEELLFIYRLILKGEDDFEVEKISNPKDYEKIAEAYMEMEA